MLKILSLSLIVGLSNSDYRKREICHKSLFVLTSVLQIEGLKNLLSDDLELSERVGKIEKERTNVYRLYPKMCRIEHLHPSMDGKMLSNLIELNPQDNGVYEENYYEKVDRHHRTLSYLFITECIKNGMTMTEVDDLVKSGINHESMFPNIEYIPYCVTLLKIAPREVKDEKR